MTVITDFTNAGFNSYLSRGELNSRLAVISILTGKDYTLSDSAADAWCIAASASLMDRSFNGDLNIAVIAPNMNWPRTGLYYDNGVVVDSTSVPELVKDFCADYVTMMIDKFKMNPQDAGVIQKTFGPVTLMYSHAAANNVRSVMEDCIVRLPRSWWNQDSDVFAGIGSASITRRM